MLTVGGEAAGAGIAGAVGLVAWGVLPAGGAGDDASAAGGCWREPQAAMLTLSQTRDTRDTRSIETVFKLYMANQAFAFSTWGTAQTTRGCAYVFPGGRLRGYIVAQALPAELIGAAN
jgi:hypothetical protein